jgi:iron-sulfur cluster assembly protein
MLTLTENATSAVKSIVAQAPEVVVEGGLRIKSSADGRTDYNVAVVPSGEPGDLLVEAEGARVFLEESAALSLDDKVLDARITEEGAVTFALGSRA